MAYNCHEGPLLTQSDDELRKKRIAVKQRRLLKSQIVEAWVHSIETDYRAKRIASERSLQASFWSVLNQIFEKNRRVFIEPTLFVHGRPIIPDLVICNSRSVIAVIELKYSPRAGPRYKKDIGNLALIAEHRSNVALSDARFRRVNSSEKVYPLANHVLFVWAGVHAKVRKLPTHLYSNGHTFLDGCFMELHAETTKTSPPAVTVRP